MIVLDASAFLAFLFQEPGSDMVAGRLADSCMSTVNLAEVVGRFARDGHDVRAVLTRLTESAVEFVPFLPEDAAITASLTPITQNLGLSLADRACIALAISRGVPVLTADRAWAALEIGVKVELVR